MFNWFKAIDKEYPYLLIIFLILLGGGLLFVRIMNYISWPNLFGVFVIGEGLYLFYKRYLKNN